MGKGRPRVRLLRPSAAWLWPLVWLAIAGAGCGDPGPDGSCTTDFDCESDQLCGEPGRCLTCVNCDRGRVGTCTAPVWPEAGAPGGIWMESAGTDEVLVYAYDCPGGQVLYRYTRDAGERCFEKTPSVDDGCG